MKRLITCLPGVGAAAATCALMAALPAAAPQVATTGTVDLPRYTGRWYEIAKFPNSFQKQCIGYVTADYRLMPDNSVEVVNRCKTTEGQIDLAVGSARVVDPVSNAKLEVSFAPSWLSWVPWVWGDYWIIELDKDYKVATVGTPNRDYLWILSRTPTLSDAEYEARVDEATKQGFDTSKLVKTKQ